jgi:glycosyltransferase involved in cell wall biosynthesis
MLEEHMARAEKLRTIYPFSNVPRLADVPELVQPFKEPLVIGAYGRFCEAKGFDRLIDAFKQTDALDNLRLVIGGFGPDDAMLRARAKDCDRISFVGKVTDVGHFLGQCHVIAVPSRYEAYGQVANEAREAGRPILVSKAGGLPEQVGDCGIIVDCEDPHQLLAALQSLRVLPLEAMGRAARKATANCRSNRINQWTQLLRSVKPELINSQEGASKAVQALPGRAVALASQCP